MKNTEERVVIGSEREARDLGIGILLQAKEDLVVAYMKEIQAEELLREADFMKQDVESFLNSDLYNVINDGVSDVTIKPQVFMENAKKDAEFRVWRKKHGCRSCKIRQCPFNAETAWDVFHKSPSKKCMKVKGGDF